MPTPWGHATPLHSLTRALGPSDHPASKRVFAPLVDSFPTDWTGPGPDPRKSPQSPALTVQRVIDGWSALCRVPMLTSLLAILPLPLRAAASVLYSLSVALYLLPAPAAMRASRTVTYGPRRDGIGSTPMLPCPIPARWLIVGALPRFSPHAALAVQRWSYPCARRSLADHHSFSMASP